MPDSTKLEKNRKSVRHQTFIMLLIAVLMFGFGYALVPLYNVLCDAFGINGKTGGQTAQSVVSSVDKHRTITVQFVSMNNAKLPWKFYPYRKSVDIHPGENTRVAYFAKNESGKTMVVQAIPSVAPSEAAKYLKKTECFCFERQTLADGETMDMPLLFHIDRDIPEDVKEITLSYTLFDVTGTKKSAPPEQRGKISK
ncbi:MAG: cytochrome c oxidase assembly protein [Gammaproteobacteria bacterium]|jgi:cytochrome c oxidase assembly protein subunit 11|nr:cytochrome c oxidase assembly protein [Gammaproteobacteria bacterium]